MKRITKISILYLTAFIFCGPFVNNLNAQDPAPGSVQMLVQKQIEEAKKKNNAAAVVIEEPAPAKKEQPKVINDANAGYVMPTGYIIKASIMLVASVVVFLWLKMRRSKKGVLEKNNRFKRNIKMMREEKFIKEIDPRLKEIRTRLTLTSVVLNEDKKVTAAARKSQIGKEEILLASRIRSHEIEYGNQRSFA